MNQIYGFEGEVKAKYTAQMYELFSEVFEWLPLAQCINGKVLVRAAAGPRAPPHPRGAACGHTCWEASRRVGVWPVPPPTPLFPLSPHPLHPRSCTGACSVRTASPWTISGRSSGTGSPQIQVTRAGRVAAPSLAGLQHLQRRGVALRRVGFAPLARTARLSLRVLTCNSGWRAPLPGPCWRGSVRVHHGEHTLITYL